MPGDAAAQERLQAAVRRMCDRMHARGPDAIGFCDDAGAGLSLGHRRLSILDLESRADQPMVSADGRYVIVYNGEIYNFRELRQSAEREGIRFRTQSDTEVLLELFAHQGEAMLPRLRGMFALAIWDRQVRHVFLARDPYGIKPLYVGRTKDGWLFASQVKALMTSGMVSNAPDPIGQAGFWMLGSVPEPHTWYRDIQALPAGHSAYLTESGMQPPRRFRDIGDAWRQGPIPVPEESMVREHVRAALQDSVQSHLVSDVPVGVFLSGGVDSGSLAALMKQAGSIDLQGITIAFREFSGRHEDEVPMAVQLAARYGVTHHIRTVTRQEFNDDLPQLLNAMDQPSVDGINTWYASKAVAELGLKVVVSGVGGDELFQGYSSFQRLPRLVSRWGRLSRLPGAKMLSRKAMALAVRRSGNQRWQHAPDWLRSISGAWWLGRGLFSPADLPALMGEDQAAAATQDFDPNSWIGRMSGILPADPRLALALIESTTYLRNQLLRDSDWASMDHSVELRTPLVDAMLLDALTPVLAGFAGGAGKAMLAQAPVPMLPDAIVDRSKTGFGVPMASWLAPAATLLGETHASAVAADWPRRWAMTVAGAMP
ncbi:MAG: asparagine synthase (glutamine-hydrolyzing) [Solirubrobacterales bacterium]|nr:asparagine synthase (glutamine-hydrolyzing) [Solirubrobacterales bacterium]